MSKNYLESILKQFKYYKTLGDKPLTQLSEAEIHLQQNKDSNSVAIIVKHLWGNMMSRWTDFLTTDGEKEWRQRDAEFENDIKTKNELLSKWNEGWDCLFTTLNPLTEKDLDTIIYIRNEGHTVMEAINRQLAHYPYHIGQMVYIAKQLKGEEFNSLSIPKNKSEAFNADKFSKEKSRKHFTDN